MKYITYICAVIIVLTISLFLYSCETESTAIVSKTDTSEIISLIKSNESTLKTINSTSETNRFIGKWQNTTEDGTVTVIVKQTDNGDYTLNIEFYDFPRDYEGYVHNGILFYPEDNGKGQLKPKNDGTLSWTRANGYHCILTKKS